MMARLSNLLRRLKSVGVGGGESTTYSGTVTDPDYYRIEDHLEPLAALHFPGLFQCGCGTPCSSTEWPAHIAKIIGAMVRADQRLEAHRRHVHVNPQGAQQ